MDKLRDAIISLILTAMIALGLMYVVPALQKHFNLKDDNLVEEALEVALGGNIDLTPSSKEGGVCE